MPCADFASILDHFSIVAEARCYDGMYPVIDFVATAIYAVICSVDDFVAIANWPKAKREWLSQ
ncbi:MAG: hypothetical protein SFV23_02340 [Planctomycetaceae bacterium]|nr:hypothetical protein [Planctomycetaceae bacterium]